MRNIYLLLLLFLFTQRVFSQGVAKKIPTINVRLSFLVAPFTPLLTFEIAANDKLTLQLESNFNDIHGANIKYYITERMDKSYVFIGSAFLQDEFLRKDSKTTFFPYLGYGYAYRLGKNKNWIIDSRVGIGSTINADSNIIFPVIKSGIGRVF